MNVRRPLAPFLSVILLLIGLRAGAQRHYVYLQSEDRTPFYVRIGSELHSSNATGYLIIPRLVDSNYVLRVGHPQGDRPTAVFAVQMGHRDHGFQLLCGGAECVLVDLQDATRIKGVMEEVKKEAVKTDAGPGTADLFTNGLALAIGDPQLTRTELIKQEVRPPAPVVEEKVVAATQAPRKAAQTKGKESAPPPQERAVSVKEEPLKPMVTPPVVVPDRSAELVKSPAGDQKVEKKPEPPIDTAVAKKEVPAPVKDTATAKPVVVEVAKKDLPKLVSEKRDEAGCSYVFLDGPGGRDTVTAWIPAEQKGGPVVATALTEQAKNDIAADLVPAKEAKVVKADSVAVAATAPEKVRTDCKARATVKDVEALKKRLGGVRDEDEKVAAAVTALKARCYDTEQLKNLCGAFARNEGKYKLMDAAYPYIYDPSRYPELETLLTDPYFVHRLKVLTGTRQQP